MDIIQAFILGVVEGITEFLPISSTGHLILTAKLLDIQESEFLKTFEITIQLGAILAVVVLYWKKLSNNSEIFKKIAAAFIPTAVIGFLLYKMIKNILGDPLVVLWSLFVGGIFLVVFERYYGKKELGQADLEVEKISYKHSFIIGLFQSISMVPGVSRAAATIIGGLIMGIPRKTIVEFSFLLAIPTMLAATAYDVYKNSAAISVAEIGPLFVGLAVSFLVALIAIKLLISYIKKHSFSGFGLYRIIAAMAFWFFIIR